MRKIIKRLLKKYHYPPEEAASALETVIRQCEQWTDNGDDYSSVDEKVVEYDFQESYYTVAVDSRLKYEK